MCCEWFYVRKPRLDDQSVPWSLSMKKLKNEKELVKKAIAEGVKYGESRGVVEFEPTDSAADKIEYIYRLLVHDKVILPLPNDQISQQSMRHRLAIWASKMD
ncbi:DUF5062 family protein [Reinekea marina]|uniref:DUF5062 family protein n=1 Tax=Reinekea marina TaxID=1310421 RepID=UPI003F495884